MTKKFRLILVMISVFFIMPLNGYLFAIWEPWFPFILIVMQAPMLGGVIYEWYKSQDRPNRDAVIDEPRDNIEI